MSGTRIAYRTALLCHDRHLACGAITSVWDSLYHTRLLCDAGNDLQRMLVPGRADSLWHRSRPLSPYAPPT
eukprot:3754450-Rhodomonas_salina.3